MLVFWYPGLLFFHSFFLYIIPHVQAPSEQTHPISLWCCQILGLAFDNVDIVLLVNIHRCNMKCSRSPWYIMGKLVIPMEKKETFFHIQLRAIQASSLWLPWCWYIFMKQRNINSFLLFFPSECLGEQDHAIAMHVIAIVLITSVRIYYPYSL